MNNSASAILECAACGYKRQAVTLVLRKRPCPVCGGVMRAAGARPADRECLSDPMYRESLSGNQGD